MKIITTLILASFLALTSLGQIATNGVYVVDGKTTEVEKKVYAFTPTNAPVVAHFSNGLIGKLQPGVDFTINSFFQDVLTTNDYHKATFGASSLATTLLSGNAIFQYAGDTNSSCVISTPLVDIELNAGLFYFEVSDQKVVVAVLDGSLKYYDNKKEVVVNTNKAVIAKPNTVGILEGKVEISADGRVQVGAASKLRQEAKDLTRDNVVFVRINGKTMGITL